MIDLRYSLVIEATEEPDFFSFYSPDLEGFSGIGHSVEDCLYKAKRGHGGACESAGGAGVTRSNSKPDTPHHH